MSMVGVDAGAEQSRLVGALHAPAELAEADPARGRERGPVRYQSICVPLDGSTESECALPLARSLGRRLGARLSYVHVHQLRADRAYTGRAEYARRENELRCEESRYLWSKVDSSDREPSAASVLMAGRIPDALLRFAREQHADLLVMTRHGAGGADSPWLGSVADRVIRSARMPVLLAPVTSAPPDPSRAPMIRRVLLPLDGSGAAEEVLEHALALGDLCGASYTLVRVETPPPFARRAPAAVEAAPEAQPKPGHAAERYLEYVAERLRSHDYKVDVQVLVDPHPASAILALAATGGADMMALTLHGDGGRQRRLIGSVADKLIRGAKIPLLVYRPRGVR
jgi:nucleotide-binding universal stress UspA family protein